MSSNIKILLLCSYVGNPYTYELERCLNDIDGVDAIIESSLNTDFNKNYDVIHIQWPEAIFNWRPPTLKQLSLLDKVLTSFKGRIVSTVHNLAPHGGRTDVFVKLYNIIYRNTDVFIHLGGKSIELFCKENPATRLKVHKVIQHGNYEYFRKKRNRMCEGYSLMPCEYVLSFGMIRKVKEVKVLCTFAGELRKSKAKLLLAGRIQKKSRFDIKYYYMRALVYLNANIVLQPGRVKDEQVAYLVENSLALFIPRVDNLNSGNVYLGFTFGKAIVGPNVGVIGEELVKTSNITFNPKIRESIKAAAKALLSKDLERIGNKNIEYSQKYLDWNLIAELHVKLYLSKTLS